MLLDGNIKNRKFFSDATGYHFDAVLSLLPNPLTEVSETIVVIE